MNDLSKEKTMIINISGYDVLIDNEDYDKIKLKKWKVRIKDGYPIVVSSYYDKKKRNSNYINMARFLMSVTDNKIDIDHINHNTLDNRKSNLRKSTHQENMFNQIIRSNNTSGFKGVSYDLRRKKYRAYIMFNAKQIWLGYYKNKKKAALKYNKKAIELFGEFAFLNKI